MILEFYLTFFFVGVVMGILDAWNKKVMFFIWLSAVIYSIATLFVGFDIQKDKGMSNWHWIGLITVGGFGMWFGKFIYESVFDGISKKSK